MDIYGSKLSGYCADKHNIIKIYLWGWKATNRIITVCIIKERFLFNQFSNKINKTMRVNKITWGLKQKHAVFKRNIFCINLYVLYIW